MTNTAKNGKFSEKRVNIITSVSTPLKFFALSVCLIEIILGIMANSAQGIERIYIIAGMIGALILMILLVAVMGLLRPDLPPKNSQHSDPPIISTHFTKIFEYNDSSEFSKLFLQHFQEAEKFYMIGTGFSMLRRDFFRILLNERIENSLEIKIYAANPFSPNVQTRLIEEEIGKLKPMIGQEGLIIWLRDILRQRGNLSPQSHFSLKLFPFYPTYALYMFDEQEYYFYPYGYGQLGTLSPVLHFSKF